MSAITATVFALVIFFAAHAIASHHGGRQVVRSPAKLSVTIIGAKARLSCELIRARSDYVIWIKRTNQIVGAHGSTARQNQVRREWYKRYSHTYPADKLNTTTVSTKQKWLTG